jgi:ABC-type glycerol-3-phosphate transport system substrate-binding protein
MGFTVPARRIMLAPALALALAAAVAACSSSSSSSSSSAPPATTAPATSAAASTPAATNTAVAVAEITSNWIAFFKSSTPVSVKVTLLQNGSAFGPAISSLMSLVSGLGTTVTGVTLNSATSATVNYNLTAGGSSLLSGQTGKAVYENGVWKVGDATLCGLLKLVPGGKEPAACSSAG